MALGGKTDISTVAGTGAPGYSGDGGPAGRASLDQPRGVAVGSQGTLYIGDTGNNAVREVAPAPGLCVVDGTDKIATLAGTGRPGTANGTGPAAQAPLDQPFGVATSRVYRGPAEPYSSNVYIADSGNNMVREVLAALS